MAPRLAPCKAREPREGLARFTAEKRFGFFDESGAVVITPRFDFAFPFSEGLAAVCMGGGVQYDGEHSFWTGGTWGYVDSKGEIAIALQYEGARTFEDGRAEVKIDGRWVGIDRRGKAESAGADMRKEEANPPEQVAPDQGVPEQKVLDPWGRDVTGEYASACRRDFQTCIRDAFLEISRAAMAEDRDTAARGPERALRCYREYFEAMKGSVSLSEEEMRSALTREAERQEAFYGALGRLSERFREHGVRMDITAPGYYDTETHWNTGMSAGCRLDIPDSGSLYACPLAPASTDAYEAPRPSPVAARVLYVDGACMIFGPHGADPDEAVRGVVDAAFGRPQDLPDLVPGALGARLYGGFLELSSSADLPGSELERLRKAYGVAAVVKKGPRTFEAVIHTGTEDDLPQGLRELQAGDRR